MDLATAGLSLWLGIAIAVVVVVAAVFTQVQATSARRDRIAAEAALREARIARDQAARLVGNAVDDGRMDTRAHTERGDPSSENR